MKEKKTIKNQLYNILNNYKRKTIELPALQDAFSRKTNYSGFGAAVLELENEGILVPVKSWGRNYKNPSLAYKYTIQKSLLQQDFFLDLQRTSLHLHPLINLDRYYKAGKKKWERDKPWIILLDRYLKSQSLPPEPVPSPERSYQITGNEKWYDEEGGRELLETVGLSDEQLAITHPPDPVAWAANPALFATRLRVHRHLVLENKTPFHALLPLMQCQQTFTTLIYGRGKAIISGLPLFCRQTGLGPGEKDLFYYFGDLDHEGIAIWYALQQKIPVKPAIPFYEALLDKEFTRGKESQTVNRPALELFLDHFHPPRQDALRRMLQAGGYLPQEALSSGELQHIWRYFSCTDH